MIDRPRRFFKLKSNRGAAAAGWLNRHTVCEMSRPSQMTARTVRLFAPDPKDPRPHVDMSYDLVMPVP
jgi:hypothetical protein